MQVTWRAPDELVERVRQVAEQEGRSMNEYLTFVLDAATNPETAGDERQRLRERLTRAGLLASPGAPRERPDPEAVARAGRAAASGTPLSDLVSEGRGEY
ncbi:Arc family DNA-binding protein [Amycolatopsis cihanbeyliensis]|nr:Arc family DNA-binding protein [Amycolatopsis cihanbeyliensis]